ncbi:hypothetical protein [Pseudomonas sp. LB3P38]|uniref:hypothetical protein n=1 Tax=Pseudomonas lyxosi TaxID=3398358 RepID=UPI0039F0DD35
MMTVFPKSQWKTAMVSITSVSITPTTSGSLQTATAALLQALQDSGFSASGSLVSTTV